MKEHDDQSDNQNTVALNIQACSLKGVKVEPLPDPIDFYKKFIGQRLAPGPSSNRLKGKI